MFRLAAFLLLPALCWGQQSLILDPNDPPVPVRCQDLLAVCSANPSSAYTFGCNWPDPCPTCPPVEDCPDTEGDCRGSGVDRECLRWVSEPDDPPPPPPDPDPPVGQELTQCRSLAGGDWYLTEDIIGVANQTCLSGWVNSLQLRGFTIDCPGSRDVPCVNIGAGRIDGAGGMVLMRKEGNPEWPRNFGGPALQSDVDTNVTLVDLKIHCEATLKNVDYGCVQNRYSGDFVFDNVDVTTEAGQCFHSTGAGDQEFRGTATCNGEPVDFWYRLSNTTVTPGGTWVCALCSNVTIDGGQYHEGLIHGGQNVTVQNGTMTGTGIVTINAGDRITVQNSTLQGGGAAYWSAAIQCRTLATNVRLLNNDVTGMGFAYYGYAPGAGCPGVVIDGGSYTAGNNDAIMCRRCPNLRLANLDLNGRIRTHGNLGDIYATNVNIVPRAGIHLDLRAQESFGPGPTVLNVAGGNSPWNCRSFGRGSRCGAVVYN